MSTWRLHACWAILFVGCMGDSSENGTKDGGSETDSMANACDEVEVPSTGDETATVLEDVVACIVSDSIQFRVAVEWEPPPTGGTVLLNVNGTAVESEAQGAVAVSAVYDAAAGTGEMRVLDLTTFMQIETQPTMGGADATSIMVHQTHAINGNTLSAVVNGRSFAFANLSVNLSVRDAEGTEISALQRQVNIPELVVALTP